MSMKHRTGLILLASLILVMIVFARAWWHGVTTARSQAQKVQIALRKGRLDEASAVIDQWLKSQPRAGQAHYLKARLAWAKNDLPLVYQEMTRARALGCPLELLAELRGLLLARMNQTTEAEPLLLKALDNEPRIDPEIAEALTHIYLGTFRLGRAAHLLDRWTEDWPDDARPFFLRTEIEGRNDASSELIITHCQEALRRDPAYHQARLRLADSLRLSHRNSEAATEYATYLEAQPNDPLGHLGAAQNALDMGDTTRSLHHLDRALALSPRDSVILGTRAVLEIHLGHLDAARRYLDLAIEVDPFNYNNHYQRMLVLNRQGKREAAQSEQLAIKRIRQDEAAFSEISRQLKEHPLDLKFRSQAAKWLMTHGHEMEAIDWAKLVLDSDPSDPEINRLLADHYRRKGNLGLANFYDLHAAPRPGQTQ